MNGYDDLVAMVSTLATEFPEATVTMRALKGSRDDDDQLIIERTVGEGVRVLRIPPASDDAVRAFYWGHLPSRPQNDGQFDSHGEGHWYGDDNYVRRVVRQFIFELVEWKTISDEFGGAKD